MGLSGTGVSGTGDPEIGPDLLELARFAESVADWTWSAQTRDALMATAGVSIPASAFLLLRYVDHFEPVSVSGLAALVGLHPSTVSTQMRPLLDHRLAVAEPDGTDRRVVSLSTTAAGRDLCERVRKVGARNWGVVLDDWSAADLAQLAELLRRVRADVLSEVAAMRDGTSKLMLNP